MNDMLLGAVVLATMVAALFFLRFWRTTGDRFFLIFALSFFIDGLNRMFLTPATPATEEVPTYYLVRLISYALILYAIVDKNLSRRKDK